jgi:uncharacterized protein
MPLADAPKISYGDRSGEHCRSCSTAAKVPLIAEATVVPSGVVRLMELQEQGWSYVRP